MSGAGLPPVGPDMRLWAEALMNTLRRSADLLRAKIPSDRPSTEAVMLWDRELQRPVVSQGGEWRGVVLLSGAPATAASPGSPGQIAIDGGFIYVCTATNTWTRAAIATW